MSSPLVITIDGPAGSGKSTVAGEVARRLGFALLDTGAIYRTLALAARRQGAAWHDALALAQLAHQLPVRFVMAEGKNYVFYGEEDVSAEIRTPEISRGASQVSAHPEVRAALLELQRRVGRSDSVVAEGRDMGTVVFPHALVKAFLQADPKVRAQRRRAELARAGHQVPVEEVLKEQQARDTADQQRAVAPLRPAADAVIIDTSTLGIEEVVQRVLGLVACRQRGSVDDARS